jgi:hypothetical protein
MPRIAGAKIKGKGQGRSMVMLTTTGVMHSDPDILGGVPVFVGTRVPIKTLLDYLEAGDPLADIPQVTAINGVINLNYIFGGVAALMYTPYVVRLFALILFT